MTMLYGVVRAGYTVPVTAVVKRVTGRDPISSEQFAQDHTGAWRTQC